MISMNNSFEIGWFDLKKALDSKLYHEIDRIEANFWLEKALSIYLAMFGLRKTGSGAITNVIKYFAVLKLNVLT